LAATTWGLGDYPAMAERLMPVARAAADLASITKGDRVLDVACGMGNGARVAVERGAEAVGIDIEPELLALARTAVPEAEFVEGDVAELPAPDAAFDVVLSIFGVMYAPDHEGAARELQRVAKPGGRIVLAAWTPGSFMPRMGAALAPYLPPPPTGSGPPSRWGDEQALSGLLDLEVAHISTLAIPADADFLIATAGHVLAERERLEAEDRWHALRADMEALVGDAEESIQLEYLLALARTGVRCERADG
jgi:SAM-dependent methyltransferase